jgi:hypothetical protein
LLQERIRLEEMARLAKLEHIRRLEDAVEEALIREAKFKEREGHVAEEEMEQRMR